jgi:DNA-binding PadR family transcriptional regulator
MGSHEPLGTVDRRVLDAVNRGALRHRRHRAKIEDLAGDPAGAFLLHESLRRCEQSGLLRSERDHRGRRYWLTAKGRHALRADRRFRLALVGLIGRSLTTPR